MYNKNTIKRSKIPYIFFTFFFVIIAINVGYIYIAKKTWRGVTTDEAYQKGLDYNATIEQAEKQKELGWQTEIKATNIGRNKLALSLILLDAKFTPIKDAVINITFRNPVQEGYDFVQKADNSKGTYKFEVQFPMKGQWDAIILIYRGNDKLYLARRYIIQ